MTLSPWLGRPAKAWQIWPNASRESGTTHVGTASGKRHQATIALGSACHGLVSEVVPVKSSTGQRDEQVAGTTGARVAGAGAEADISGSEKLCRFAQFAARPARRRIR